MEKLTYTVDEIGQLLGISRPKAYELANRKDFPTLRIGKRILIPAERFHQWLNTETDENSSISL